MQLGKAGRPREYNLDAILNLRARGYTPTETAKDLGCTVETVLRTIRKCWLRDRDPRAVPSARSLSQINRVAGGHPKHKHRRRRAPLPATIRAETYTLPQWNETLGVQVEQRRIYSEPTSAFVSGRSMLVSLPRLTCLQEPLNG